MTSSPASSPSLKRRRQDIGGGKARAAMGSSVEPSPEARAGWANDFPERFEVLAKIGEGTFSTVWTARPSERGDDASRGEGGGGLVALKRINPTCSPTRILNEFEQMRQLGGRCNVVQVQGVIRTPGGAFALVMPFFEHDEFRQYMKTLTLSGVAAYMRSLLTALAHVHKQEVIHRDVKPRNFMYNATSGRGLLIDFGLAEPAEKWKARSEALAKHRDRRARRKQAQGNMSHGAGPEAQSQRRASGGPSKDPQPPRPVAGREENAGKFSTEDGREARPLRDGEGNGHGKEDRLKLLRKMERGGTTGFRAPEILWHSRDQEPAVDVWSAGVILLCLLSRRYPLFPSADNDEMALVQIAALLGPDDVVRAARSSGRCHVAELPSRMLRRGTLEGLCAPLLGGAVCDESEGKARADALSLLKGMLTVDPRKRLSAREALMHRFVTEA